MRRVIFWLLKTTCMLYRGTFHSEYSETKTSNFLENIEEMFPLYIQLLVDNEHMIVWTRP